jgi:hypothetical protein
MIKKESFKHIALFFSWIYIAITPLWIGIHTASVSLSAIALFCGIGLVLISVLPEIKLFRAGPVMAEMRQVISEAEVTIEQLRGVAKALAKSSLSSIARSGWIGGLPERLQEGLRSEIEKNLLDLGITKQEIVDVQRDYHECIALEYRNMILGFSNPQVLQFDEATRCNGEWKALRREPVSPPLSATKIRDFLAKYNLTREHLDRHLELYEYYLLHKTHLNFDEFVKFREQRNDEVSWAQLAQKGSL